MNETDEKLERLAIRYFIIPEDNPDATWAAVEAAL